MSSLVAAGVVAGAYAPTLAFAGGCFTMAAYMVFVKVSGWCGVLVPLVVDLYAPTSASARDCFLVAACIVFMKHRQ